MIEREAIGDPNYVLPPILEPGFYDSVYFSFRPQTREWWLRVVEYKCQWEYYDEKKGWQQCTKWAKQVHHIIPEGWLLQHGSDPEHSIGLPLCNEHHSKNPGGIWEKDGSFHNDVASDYHNYKNWKQQQEHMNSITGRRTIDYSTSPFAETNKEHQEKARKGQRYWNGDETTDEYYITKMANLAFKYIVEHPEDPKPKSSPHSKYDINKRKRWYK